MVRARWIQWPRALKTIESRLLGAAGEVNEGEGEVGGRERDPRRDKGGARRGGGGGKVARQQLARAYSDRCESRTH